MTRVLETGVPGVGKSSVILRLRGLGYEASDMDDEGWSYFRDDGEYAWREDRLTERLDRPDDGVLFVGGGADNMVRFYDRFDRIVLRSAPPDVMTERLYSRTNNPFGKRPDELEGIMRDREVFEPIMRRRAHGEIVTTIAVNDVVEQLLEMTLD